MHKKLIIVKCLSYCILKFNLDVSRVYYNFFFMFTCIMVIIRFWKLWFLQMNISHQICVKLDTQSVRIKWTVFKLWDSLPWQNLTMVSFAAIKLLKESALDLPKKCTRRRWQRLDFKPINFYWSLQRLDFNPSFLPCLQIFVEVYNIIRDTLAAISKLFHSKKFF